MSTYRVKTEGDYKWKRDPDDNIDDIESYMRKESSFTENGSRRRDEKHFGERDSKPAWKDERDSKPTWKDERRKYDDGYNDARSHMGGPPTGERSTGSTFYRGGNYFCETCDVTVPSHSMLVAHLSGKEHKRKAKPIERFYCDTCLVEVSSAETLENHEKGAQHKKKVAHMEEERRKRKRHAYLETDHIESEREEIIRLRADNARMEMDIVNLQESVRSLTQQVRFCRLNHNREDSID